MSDEVITVDKATIDATIGALRYEPWWLGDWITYTMVMCLVALLASFISRHYESSEATARYSVCKERAHNAWASAACDELVGLDPERAAAIGASK